jgi:thioredoxin 1
MARSLQNITDATFEQDVLKSDLPVLLSFWAEWSSPSKQQAETLETLASEYDGKLVIVMMNVDSNLAVPARHGVRAIPMLILFKNGMVCAQKMGVQSSDQIKSVIDSNI